MTIPELIGFLIAIGALLFSFFRKILEARRQALDPEGYQKELEEQQKEQELAYREMLDSLGIAIPEEEKKPTPILEEKKQPSSPLRKTTTRRNVTQDFEFHSSLEDRKKSNQIENRTFETSVGNRFGKGYGQKIVAQEFRGMDTSLSRTKNRESKIHRLVDRLPSKKDLVVYREILGPPRGLDPWDGDSL